MLRKLVTRKVKAQDYSTLQWLGFTRKPRFSDTSYWNTLA